MLGSFPSDEVGKSYRMCNEFDLVSEGAFDCLSLPFSFRKEEILLIPCQTKARTLNEPVKPIQAKVQLVAHPVGRTTFRGISSENEFSSAVVPLGCMGSYHYFHSHIFQVPFPCSSMCCSMTVATVLRRANFSDAV